MVTYDDEYIHSSMEWDTGGSFLLQRKHDDHILPEPYTVCINAYSMYWRYEKAEAGRPLPPPFDTIMYWAEKDNDLFSLFIYRGKWGL